MSIEFPLLQKHTPFGPISDPNIPIDVKTLRGFLTHWFLMDTGADFSMTPRRLAQEIGLEWDVLPEAHVMCIEQVGVNGRLGNLPIRVHKVDLNVRCIFVESPKSLFILGRADFLDRFVLTIDHHQKRIILNETS